MKNIPNEISTSNRSKLHIEIDSRPTEIDQVERVITQLEIERQALQREEDAASRERLSNIEEQIAALREKSSGMKAKWQAEKDVIEKIKANKGQLEELKIQADQAQRAGDYNKASEIL